MKLAYFIRNRGRTLAIFGTARLIKDGAGRIQLHGGSLDDRRAAREWCSHFLHEAAIDVHPPGAVSQLPGSASTRQALRSTLPAIRQAA